MSETIIDLASVKAAAERIHAATRENFGSTFVVKDDLETVLTFIRAASPVSECDEAPPAHFLTPPLTAVMDNVLASVMGKCALEAGDPRRTDVGDSIDRGLILLRLLVEKGFSVRHPGWNTAWGVPEVAARPLHPDHIRAERRACMFGDVIESYTYVMQAAVIEQHAGAGAESAMTWIVNTLAGPGHMPDLDAAVALPAAKEVGPAQAWFDMKSAEHDAFRAAHPMPAAPTKGVAHG